MLRFVVVLTLLAAALLVALWLLGGWQIALGALMGGILGSAVVNGLKWLFW
jgi:hypothetical protein